DRLKSLCDQINQSSTTPRAVALALDVTADAPAIEAAVEKAWATFGHIDCLINNAGIRGSTSSTIELTKEEWDNVFKTNLDGAWLCSKY
ncbi:SDR family oxidoreductase, partial [Klebsiella pneumoniae]|uniref:SDR family oxidoreductase n=1 Tax=Klebsiella pneumoniae TaxID=573 RepID=UPI003013FDAE